MAKTLYNSGNFVIADDNGEQKQVSAAKSSYKEENDTFIVVDDVTRKRIVIPFSEAAMWEDAETGGSAYTEATLRAFIRANFSTASGGSGATTFTNPDTGFEITNETGQINGFDVPQATCKVENSGILYSIGAQDISNLGGGFQTVLSAINLSDFSGAAATLTESRISLQINSAGGSPNTSIIIENGTINFKGLPTNSLGLETGDIWNNSGVLTIV